MRQRITNDNYLQYGFALLCISKKTVRNFAQQHEMLPASLYYLLAIHVIRAKFTLCTPKHCSALLNELTPAELVCSYRHLNPLFQRGLIHVAPTTKSGKVGAASDLKLTVDGERLLNLFRRELNSTFSQLIS